MTGASAWLGLGGVERRIDFTVEVPWMINKSRLGVLLVRTLLFFVLAVVMGFFYHWPSFAVIAAALTGAAALVQFGGWLWLRRAEEKDPVAAAKAEPKPHSEFL